MSKEPVVPVILSCPFCGGSARITCGQHIGNRESTWRWVRCDDCGAQSAGFCRDSSSKTERAAVVAWNKRVTP